MKAAAEELGVDFISSFDVICAGDRCKFFADDGSLLFWDMHHLTVQGATWFGAEVVGALEKMRSELPRPEKSLTTGQSTAPKVLADMPFEEAVKIMQGYMSELTRIGMNGKAVQDVSLLRASKSEIGAALLMVIKDTTDEETKSNYKTGYIVLAFFQPDVGETAAALEQTGPQQETWQEIVDSEMKKRGETLADLGY